ncbi:MULTISPECIES: GspE/PulE/PilB domain-containing protein [Acidithiobacillus]|uniref:GspE/PulE/PilB domain-containing protein n=1 Tax=Acidithiobacillus TaxID=119977 RepID=UPI001C07705A|nr:MULTISPECIES: type II secretion protein [Acidithiobacillus]MBU2762735.1 type II secretion protein [Acidithiobacillus caldus]MBU2771388.1 type II secretion protein [Acidithiobacillus caldus]MBU2791074.1 type II secretion protein [Acidithiobacillus caldus]MBU2822182.1 type II secretion protein [Acidithiobacillus caldus]MCE5420582.1 type II secretion protein [Acidithiobacillus sp.]
MNPEPSPYAGLVDSGHLSPAQWQAAQESASRRQIPVERVLLRDFGLSRCALLEVLSRHYACPFVQYDERLPVPTSLFAGLDPKMLRAEAWFPVRQLGDTVVVAAAVPDSPTMRAQVRTTLSAANYEFRVALREDIHWYIQDYLHAAAPLLIGIERTGLAYWRNTMALWRTKLAAHRTAHARARTSMKLLRWGLAMVALAHVLTHLRDNILSPYYLPILVVGIVLAAIGLFDYLQVRGSRMDLPCQKELIRITAANVRFTERYHLAERPCQAQDDTHLARLAATIPPYCSIIPPVPASKERTYLARERNMLAAQRTIASSHRTSYARARTGLSLIRTGVAFIGLGIAIHKMLGVSPYGFTEYLLMGAGVLMLVDGLIWYLPVRRLKYGIGREIKP